MTKIMLLESRNFTFSRETRAGDVVSYSFFPKKSSRNPSLKRFILTQQFLQGSLILQSALLGKKINLQKTKAFSDLMIGFMAKRVWIRSGNSLANSL